MSIPASGDRINYSLRPAKSVERKMLKDIFSSLHPFGSVSEYKYIGFGSKYFSDFKLFHRALHINDMISIERDKENSDKYEFNKPFECVQLELGESNDVLSRMAFKKKFIAWLDYDTAINKGMLVDIEILIENLYPGSIILSTFNSVPFRIVKLQEEFKDEDSTHSELLRKKLKNLVPSEFVPRDIPKKKLASPQVYSSVVKLIFENKINSALLQKNAALSEQEKWKFAQLVYFNYKDGADMSTLGWIFYQNKDLESFNNCAFNSLDFYKNATDPYQIDIPNLTIKEIRFLQESMPLPEGEIDREKIPLKIYSDEDVFSFSKVYKYFPNFMDIEIA